MEVRHVQTHVKRDDKQPHEARQTHRVPEVRPRKTCQCQERLK